MTQKCYKIELLQWETNSKLQLHMFYQMVLFLMTLSDL